jgi:hypothetical protein
VLPILVSFVDILVLQRGRLGAIGRGHFAQTDATLASVQRRAHVDHRWVITCLLHLRQPTRYHRFLGVLHHYPVHHCLCCLTRIGHVVSVALSLGISSVLSLLAAGALALSLVIPGPTNHSRPISRSLGKSLRHVSQFLVSFFLFAPAAVNLALIFAWRNTRSEFSLRGRCHWNLDVVWTGVGGQCPVHAPAWGVWLAAAISRFVLTVAILVRDMPPE